jgi:hypothetical protein
MKTALALLLIASTAFADPPKPFRSFDGCNSCTDLGNGAMSCTARWCGPMPALKVQATQPMDAPPADAPVRDLDAPGRSLVLEQGSIAPFSGVLLDEQEDVRRERARVRAEVTVEKASEGVLLPRAAFIAIVLGCATASAAVAAGVTAWALKK